MVLNETPTQRTLNEPFLQKRVPSVQNHSPSERTLLEPSPTVSNEESAEGQKGPAKTDKKEKSIRAERKQQLTLFTLQSTRK